MTTMDQMKAASGTFRAIVHDDQADETTVLGDYPTAVGAIQSAQEAVRPGQRYVIRDDKGSAVASSDEE